MLCQNTCDVPFGITAMVSPEVLCCRVQLAERSTSTNKHEVVQAFRPANGHVRPVCRADLKVCTTSGVILSNTVLLRQLQLPKPPRGAAEHGVSIGAAKCRDVV